jgi:arginase
MTLALTIFQGRAGDHNDLGIPGARAIGDELASSLGIEAVVVGTPQPALNTGWKVELAHALPDLEALRVRFESLYASGSASIAATSRCAASLATLPVIANYRPDACIVWFDAHADLNTPEASESGYLGGLALSAPIGLWDSCLGQGLSINNVVLVGQRDLDPFEVDVITAHNVPHIKPDAGLLEALKAVIKDRPVYVHLDCDVLNPGIVPTDYQNPYGLSVEDLHKACAVLAENEVVGLEIAEFQSAWNIGGEMVSPRPIINAVQPLIDRMVRQSTKVG